jgi:hypothetical protein
MKRSKEKLFECPDCCDEFLEIDLYEDMRDPPIDDGPCLCVTCFKAAANERIEEMEAEIAQIKQAVARAKG